MTMRGNERVPGAGRPVVLLLAGVLGGGALALGGCASLDLRQIAEIETTKVGRTFADPKTADDPAAGDERGEPGEAEGALSRDAAELARKAQEERERPRVPPVLYPGSDLQVALPEAREPVRFLGDEVSLNFEQAPLEEIVHAILSDILQLDYIVDRPVEGSVTLRTRTPMARDELLVVLESLLKAHGALLMRREDGRYLVTGAQQGVSLRPEITSAADVDAGYSTVVVPLQFIAADAMRDILEPLAEQSAFVRVDSIRNLLVLAGTRAQLSGWLDIITTFDVDLLAGMSVGFFPLEHSDVEETAAAISELLRTAGGADLSSIVRVMPMERLSSLLVVSPRAHYLDQVGNWIQRLDIEPDARFEKRLYVYPVQNTTAARLAGLLNRIYSGVGADSAGDSNAVAPGMQPETIGGAIGAAGGGIGRGSIGGDAAIGQGGAIAGQGGAAAGQGIGGPGADQSFAPSGSGGGGTALVTMGAAGSHELGDVRVVADDVNNALMIYSDGRQYDIIADALKELDVAATQVIIEASIMEVQLTDNLKYGLQWVFKNGFSRGRDGLGQYNPNRVGPIAAEIPGFSYTVKNASGDISAVLNALSEESLVNIISTPSLMVLDNHTASIAVGDQVPVEQGATTILGGSTVQNIVFKNTGVQLSVRPSVNAGGLVTMDIRQSVVDIGDIESTTRRRTFLNRSINSRVAVRSSESVVLGGLIRENSTLNDSGVPVLHKIPLLGSLFGTTGTRNRRTELLVIITPRALYNEDELREVSQEMREQVRFMELLQNPPRTGSASASR